MDTNQISPRPAYRSLKRRFERIATIEEAGAMLGWDAAAVMPDGGAAARGEQLAVLASVGHGMLSDTALEAELADARDELPPVDTASEPDGWDRRNLELMARARLLATALPDALVEDEARRSNSGEQVWRQARPADDFASVLPELTGLLAIVREKAARLSQATGLAPYDALMDLHQPGITSAEVRAVFDRYESFMRDALPRAEQRRDAQPPTIPIPTPIDEDRQEALCRRLSQTVGLDFSHARLDRSAHPFCGGTPTDVRITTRYDPNEPSRALLGVLHETGHALYERGLPAEWRRQPIGRAAGMAVHESQSLIVEMQACRSDPFLAWLGGELATAFGADSPAYAPDNLQRLWRRVERSLIRVDADEMTYPAHVILRFRLEQAMVEGTLEARDLPAAWSDGLERLLGIRPPDDRRGCLQDIHWYAGLFGYFPSYSLGAMGAAQLMASCRDAAPDLDARLGRGDLSGLTGWLAANVHALGARYGMNDLLAHATGRPLDPSDFERHLTLRYLQ